MSDHLVLYVDHIQAPQTVETPQPDITSSEDSSIIVTKQKAESSDANNDVEIDNVCDEEQPLIQMVECRICQEEDHIKNSETPCVCSGSLKYAHRACVQRWCNEKGDTTCEICHQAYKPGYTAPHRSNPDDTTIDISDGWTITGSQIDLRDPRILAMAAAQHRFLEAEYAANVCCAAYCRSAYLIFMALYLLSCIYDDDDASAYFSRSLLRAAGFVGFVTMCAGMSYYTLAWVSRRQRQEAAALAATEVAFIIQSGQARGGLTIYHRP